MFDLAKRIVKDPVTQTLVLGAVFVAIFGLFRPPEMVERRGVDPKHLFLSKAHYAADYDMVLAGDSRMYTCLSPAKMVEVLGNIEIINFGFELTGFDAMYLDRIRETIDGDSKYASVVLGVTPTSLTPASAQNNGFKSSIRKTGWPLMRDMYMPRVLNYFEPYDLRYLIRYVRGENPSRYLWYYNADGFIDVDKVPLVSEDKLDAIKKTFDGNKVADDRIDLLCERVAKWTDEGIEVYGFRPPTSDRVAAMEDQYSGYDEPEIRRRFEAAGGTWLETQHGIYGTYDGHHLLGSAARKFSIDLAQKMIAKGWVGPGQ